MIRENRLLRRIYVLFCLIYSYLPKKCTPYFSGPHQIFMSNKSADFYRHRAVLVWPHKTSKNGGKAVKQFLHLAFGFNNMYTSPYCINVLGGIFVQILKNLEKWLQTNKTFIFQKKIHLPFLLNCTVHIKDWDP